MISLFLAAAAWGDDAARLLGPEPAMDSAASTVATSPWAGLWPLALAAALAAGLWLWQRRPGADRSAEPATVEAVTRHSLGGAHLLHVVDVEDRAGRVHRLVLSTGTAGAATLVAHLGADDHDLRAPATVDAAPEAAPAPARATAETWASRYAEATDVARPYPWVRAERAYREENASREESAVREERPPPEARPTSGARPAREESASREPRVVRSDGTERAVREDRPERRADPREERRPTAVTPERRAQALSLIDEVVGTREAPTGRRGLRA